MKWLNEDRMNWWLVTSVAFIVLGSQATQAEIIMSKPVNVGPVINDAQDMQECDFSHDGLELYFSANRPGGYGRADIWVAKRDTLNSPWQEPVNLGPNVNSADAEVEPSISGDGLELYLGSWDDFILRVCKRPTKDAPWGGPEKIGPPVGSLEQNIPEGSDDVYTADISADGLSLYFASSRVGGYGKGDIWVATRASKNDPWTEPINLGPNVNSGTDDWSPSISSDGLTLIIGRENRTMLWATTRKSIHDSWGPTVNLGIEKEGKTGWQHGAALSPDGSCLYFEAYTSQWGGYGAGDYWQVDFTPIVNFNGDEIIDLADLVILIEHWGKEDLLCDIGPLPLGDGAVDAADLAVLMSYLEQDAFDPSLIAHWPLDEAQGDIAYNNGSDRDGTLMGGPIWQPEGGIVGGALQFDGLDDYVRTDPVLNPADGAFSVVAWIRGGAPGQVVISGAMGSNWLTLDAEGKLMTELESPARSSTGPLLSEANVTDGNWHRIGFVWDGSYRHLHVNGVEVAADVEPLTTLEGSGGGLYLAAGSDLAPATFFSGMIDDVRIYNRAVSP